MKSVQQSLNIFSIISRCCPYTYIGSIQFDFPETPCYLASSVVRNALKVGLGSTSRLYNQVLKLELIFFFKAMLQRNAHLILLSHIYYLCMRYVIFTKMVLEAFILKQLLILSNLIACQKNLNVFMHEI